jgi:tetratricopeptide (TPR) repeat protein
VLAIASSVVAVLFVRAEREAATTRAVNAFLNDDLLASANPYRTPDPDLRVREVLDRAGAAVGERFAERPAEEAAVRTSLGRSYAGIGNHDEARRQLSRALELASGAEALSLRRALVENDVEDSRYDEAEKAYADLAADIAAAKGADSDEALAVEVARAHIEIRRNRYESAIKKLAPLVSKLRERGDAMLEVRLDAMCDLGQAYRNVARWDEAEMFLREVHDTDVARFGKTHWRTLQSSQELAVLARARGHLDDAIAIERGVLATREKAFGRTHEETQNALNELASMLQDKKDYAEAEPIFREVLATREKTLGERHERTRNAMNNLALVLSQSKQLDEAEALYRRALAIERETLGDDDLGVLILVHNLGGLERDRGDLAAAEALNREAVAGAARTLPPERPENGLFMTGLARTLEKAKRYEEAADAFSKARANLVAAYGPDHVRVKRLTEMQTALYADWGRPVPAELR